MGMGNYVTSQWLDNVFIDTKQSCDKQSASFKQDPGKPGSFTQHPGRPGSFTQNPGGSKTLINYLKICIKPHITG